MKSTSKTPTTTPATPNISANDALLGTAQAQPTRYESVGFIRINADLIQRICADPDACYEGRSNRYITVECWLDSREDGYCTLVQTPALKARLTAERRYLPSIGVCFKSLTRNENVSAPK